MLNLPNVTLVSIDSAYDHPSKSNIRLAVVSRVVEWLKSEINFGDYLFINPFGKNKDLINEKFECLWPLAEGSGYNPIMWYSNFLIKKLPHLIKTDYYLIMQWDGFPINAQMWTNDFFNYEYIGGGHSVFNGGLSLRKTQTMLEVSKVKDSFGSGAEDGFYSSFLDNEWNSKKETPIKLKWNTNVSKTFCNFLGNDENGNLIPAFAWHRSQYSSEQFLLERYRDLQIFSNSEIDKIKTFSLLKSIPKEFIIDNYIKDFDIDFNENFFNC